MAGAETASTLTVHTKELAETEVAMKSDAHDVGRPSRHLVDAAAILGLLLIAIVAVEVPKYVVVRYVQHGIALNCALILCQLLMAGFPFLLAAIAPSAKFDCPWLPSTMLQWLWFPVFVLLMFIVYLAHDWLMSFGADWWLVSVVRETMIDIAPVNVALSAVILILFAPVAEELFWRAFLLRQLEKLTRWPVALIVHSFLYSLAHIPNYWSVLVASFLYGTVLAFWRIRFQSILPLVLAHMIVNTVAFGPHLATQYRVAVQAYSKCRQIDHLVSEPVSTAVPALISMMGDRDRVVSLHALEALEANFSREAEPYFAEAMASSDDYTVERVLFAIESFGHSGLRRQVRAVAWSSENLRIQVAAVMALRGIGDDEGLREIAQEHREERVRRAAENVLMLLRVNHRANDPRESVDGR